MVIKHDPPLVLVADDEVNTTIMLQRIFEREGYQVETVNDGLAALRAAQERVPDLILLDIRMPGMTGFEVLRSLREHPVTSTIPTILITANAREPADVARGLDLGADDYLYKPFAPQELIARAQSKMKARQLEEALQRRTRELESLLRVSEELNQHLEGSELLKVILDLVFNLLPVDVAMISQFDDDGQIFVQRTQQKQPDRPAPEIPDDTLYQLIDSGQPLIWPGPNTTPLFPEFKGGMAVPLTHGYQALGVLILCSYDVEYDDNHFQLLRALARQASLALRNAVLHEIQVNYAVHLEDMVAERTAELQSAQQLLVRSEKLASIGRLAANIAHEINNPLQPITVTLDDLVETVNSNMPVDIRGIEIIQESVERIRRIVSQLLEFAGRRNTGPDLQMLDLGQILERIVDLNRKFFEKERLNIQLDMRPLPAIYGSKDQLEQVFMNLTLNAQAAMPPGGSLTIRAFAKSQAVVVEFSDTGCGIEPEQIDKIFDPFFSTKPSGTGLGLFVTYGIIQGHHGSIDVASEVNVGTTFTITLPIQQGK